jgi:hypothetical protein
LENHQLFEEAVGDFRRSAHGRELFKLKTIWLPGNFDADKEDHRVLMRTVIRDRIVNDILINVVFGNLSEEHIRFFLGSSGVPGLNLAILSVIANEGFVNIAALTKRLDISAGPIREKLPLIAGAGFIASPIGALRYEVTLRGRVFLELLRRLFEELETDAMSEELIFVLERVGCPVMPIEAVTENTEVFPSNLYILLMRTVVATAKQWGIQP